ncbi:MAG: AhpC/TSA family protein [Candidatus Symbiothrix sp.]|jgi:peroxiredoxin|nr:AhpC/TSA family protein [Candidatus Symbiothrix sp.]
MKRIGLFALCLLALNACAQKENTYSLTGKIGNYNDPAEIYLQYVENNDVVSRSGKLKDGKFSFEGTILSPTGGRLVILPKGGKINNNRPYEESLSFILSDEKIEVNSPDLLQNATISGSKLNAEHRQLTDSIAAMNTKVDLLVQEYRKAPFELANSKEYALGVERRYQTLQAEIINTYMTFIKEHPDSYASVLAIKELEQQTNNINLADSLLKGLSPEIQNTDEGLILTKRIGTSKLTAIGSVAPDFTLNNAKGEPVSLSDFRGKYLLIDFWASWCGPCRRENPNLVNIYNWYKNRNFEILGVSIDQPTDKYGWTTAIEKDHLTWPQLLDVTGQKESVALQYNISTIPQNLLLDPNGVIVAKNLRGDALPAKLSELLN